MGMWKKLAELEDRLLTPIEARNDWVHRPRSQRIRFGLLLLAEMILVMGLFGYFVGSTTGWVAAASVVLLSGSFFVALALAPSSAVRYATRVLFGLFVLFLAGYLVFVGAMLNS